MTLDEFLNDYVPRVLKPLGRWEMWQGWKIRRGASCPLTADERKPASYGAWPSAQRLGLSLDDMNRIIAAADNFRSDPDFYRPEIRARLLAGLGLTEPSK